MKKYAGRDGRRKRERRTKYGREGRRTEKEKGRNRRWKKGRAIIELCEAR